MKFAHAVCLSVHLFTSKIGFAFNRAFIYHYALDYQQDQEFVDRHDHVACVLWLACCEVSRYVAQAVAQAHEAWSRSYVRL